VGEYGVEYVSGVQNGRSTVDGKAEGTSLHTSGFGGRRNGRYMKAVSIVKHSFDYDLEGNHEVARTAFDAVVSEMDQNNYFSPPFKAVVSRAHAGGLMCSYNSVNGLPSCMNGAVNNGIVRDQWGMDGIIVSDWYVCVVLLRSHLERARKSVRGGGGFVGS
jgi:beta-glucosidase-like glycosyl hydrolase